MPRCFGRVGGLTLIVTVGPLQGFSVIALALLRGSGACVEEVVCAVIGVVGGLQQGRAARLDRTSQRHAARGCRAGSAGEPEAHGVEPAKAPQATQSSEPTQQAAPPSGSSEGGVGQVGGDSKVGRTPVSPTRIVCWLALVGQSHGKREGAAPPPAGAVGGQRLPIDEFWLPTYICSST